MYQFTPLMAEISSGTAHGGFLFTGHNHVCTKQFVIIQYPVQLHLAFSVVAVDLQYRYCIYFDVCACFFFPPGQRKWFGMDQAAKATGKQTTTAKHGGQATAL